MIVQNHLNIYLIKKNFTRDINQPIFIEVLTYRYNEHTGPKEASNYDYSNLRELNYWKNDPLIN